MNKDNWKEFLLTALLAAVGAIVMGLIFFGHGIFDKNRVGFQFLSFGLMGGFLFASFRYLKWWLAAIVLVVLIVLDEAVLHSNNWDYIWQDVLYYAALSASLFVFAGYYLPRLEGAVLGRVLMLSSLVAAFYIIVTIVFYFIFLGNPMIPRFNLSQMIYYDLAQGFLLGFGLGFGLEIADFVVRKTLKGSASSSN